MYMFARVFWLNTFNVRILDQKFIEHLSCVNIETYDKAVSIRLKKSGMN